MKEGLVSVIIPCYNNAQYIRKCVDSVLSQTYQNFEIIIVNDGSTDNPEKRLEDIKDSRLKPIIRTKNQGVSTARNIGIEASEGEFIIFIDGDDWIEPTHLQLLISGVRDSDCTFVLMSVDKENGSFIPIEYHSSFKKYSKLTKLELSKHLDELPIASPCNKIYRSELLKHKNYIRFDTDITYGEDLIFNLKYLQNVNEISLINKATYHYIQHYDSSSPKFHSYALYTVIKLTHTLNKTFYNFSESIIILLMRYYLWAITNIFKSDSNLSNTQKQSIVKYIFSLKEFKNGRRLLKQMNISTSLRFILRQKFNFFIFLILKFKMNRK